MLVKVSHSSNVGASRPASVNPMVVVVPVVAGPSTSVMLVSSTVTVAFAVVAKVRAYAAAESRSSLLINRSFSFRQAPEEARGQVALGHPLPDQKPESNESRVNDKLLTR